MKWLKVSGVIFFAVVITALGIDASDTLKGVGGTLLGQVISSQQSICPDGMVHVPSALTFTCVDRYEASAGSACPHPNPTNEIESRENVESTNCEAVSSEMVEPWRYLSREYAAVACTRAGKRLPKSEEWYTFAAGSPDSDGSCNISSGTLAQTGEFRSCVSASGIHDTIGNVWEWTTDDVIAGVYQGRALPEEGYVSQVDSSGVATITDTKNPSALFYQDYLWSSPEGAYGVLRGGFYASGNDAGVYSVQARTAPTAAGTAIGFRCVL